MERQMDRQINNIPHPHIIWPRCIVDEFLVPLVPPRTEQHPSPCKFYFTNLLNVLFFSLLKSLFEEECGRWNSWCLWSVLEKNNILVVANSILWFVNDNLKVVYKQKLVWQATEERIGLNLEVASCLAHYTNFVVYFVFVVVAKSS